MSLSVRRMSVTLNAPQGAAERQARAALDALPRTAPDALSRHLGPLCPREDPRVVIIPRLRFAIDLDGDVTAATIADRIAQAVEAGVAQVLSDGAGAVTYADEAALLADWLAARLAGRVAHHGRFRRFRGLEHLPPGQALQTFLSRAPETAWSRLVAVPEGTLTRLWPVLDAADAERILALAATLPDGAPQADDWAVLAKALTQTPGLPPATAAMSASVRTMATLRRCEAWIAAAALPAAQTLAQQASAATQRSSTPQPHKATPQNPARRGATAPDVPNDLARALTEQGKASAGRIAPETTPIDTPFAGYAIFLAFPAFTTLAHATLPPPARNVHAHNALALCLLDTLAGANALRLIDDPGWRTLLDVPKHLRSADLERWADAQTDLWRALTPSSQKTRHAVSDALLHSLAQRLPGFGKASAAFLRANVLNAGGTIDARTEPVRITLNRPPLDIVLAMSGLADREVLLPDGRVAMVERMR